LRKRFKRGVALIISMAEVKKIVRIAGADMIGEVQLISALRKVKGVSHSYANAVVRALGLDPKRPVGGLSKEEMEKIADAMKNPTNHGIPKFMLNRQKDFDTGEEKHLISSDIELVQSFDLKRLKKIKSYRGFRHSYGLKVRGQRTKSTGRKGSTVGVKRKKSMPAKTTKKKGGK
jgi:small subunit ribosomal protein S13